MGDNFDPLLAGIAVALAVKDKKKKKGKKEFDFNDENFDLEASIAAHFDDDED
jgi:hypothetical protein